MDHSSERARFIAFFKLLLGDVMEARARLASGDTQTARRDVVRSSLAAMEGMAWLVREHVRTALFDIDKLSPTADLALREQAYAISDTGKLDVQSRSQPLPTAIRFVIAQAKIISPEITIDFDTAGWPNLRRSIGVRNRITHPKPETDLSISDSDLECVGSGLSWLLATIIYVMASTNLALVTYNRQLKELLARLSAGDPEAIAVYQTALRQIKED